MSITSVSHRPQRGNPEEPGHPHLQQKTSNQERRKHGGGGAANADHPNTSIGQIGGTGQLPPSDSVMGRPSGASGGTAWGSKGPPSPARLRTMSARAETFLPLERSSVPATQREGSKSARTRGEAAARWGKATQSARMSARRTIEQQRLQQQPLVQRRSALERQRMGAALDRRLARHDQWQPIDLEESDSEDEDATLQELRLRQRTRAGHFRRLSSMSNQWNMLKTYMEAFKKKPPQTVFVPEEHEVTRFWRIKVSDENAKFFEAVRQNNVDNMNAALALGADPTARDEDGYNALHIAVEVDSLAALHALLLSGEVPVSAPDTQGVTPLHLAVEMGKRLLVNSLIMAGARIDAVDRFGRNPLHYAIRGGKVRIVKLLLYCGADPNMADSYGTTPLSMAVLTRPYPDIARSLLMAGAIMDVESGAGVYLLSEAVLSCFTETHLDAIRVLVESGAEVNRQEDVSGQTALHLAALSDNGSVAEILLLNGADPSITNFSGETAVEMALLHGSRDVLQVITDATETDDLKHMPMPKFEPKILGHVGSMLDELFDFRGPSEENIEDEGTTVRQPHIQRGSSGIIHSVAMQRTPVAGPLAGVEIPDKEEGPPVRTEIETKKVGPDIVEGGIKMLNKTEA